MLAASAFARTALRLRTFPGRSTDKRSYAVETPRSLTDAVMIRVPDRSGRVRRQDVLSQAHVPQKATGIEENK